jgi:hypothetical protein
LNLPAAFSKEKGKKIGKAVFKTKDSRVNFKKASVAQKNQRQVQPRHSGVTTGGRLQGQEQSEQFLSSFTDGFSQAN